MPKSRNLSLSQWMLTVALVSVFINHPAFCQTARSAASNNISSEAGLLQTAAEKGDAHSQCLLGMSYALGKGMPKDNAKAAYWLKKAADQGFMQAQNLLGLMYRDGTGVPQDYAKAAEWLQKAVDQGDDIAKMNLETMRSQGKLGNFAVFQASMAKAGFLSSMGVLNGFSMYQSKENKLNFVSMRSCDGYCCEGLVSTQPMDEKDLDAYILFVYSPLQNTLYLANKDSVANGFKERVVLLREEIMTNLKQSNRTEFAFDHLNVRGECPPVSDAEFKAGHRPQLTIKLWIP
jgi:hypothetical protein